MRPAVQGEMGGGSVQLPEFSIIGNLRRRQLITEECMHIMQRLFSYVPTKGEFLLGIMEQDAVVSSAHKGLQILAPTESGKARFAWQAGGDGVRIFFNVSCPDGMTSADLYGYIWDGIKRLKTDHAARIEFEHSAEPVIVSIAHLSVLKGSHSVPAAHSMPMQSRPVQKITEQSNQATPKESVMNTPVNPVNHYPHSKESAPDKSLTERLKAFMEGGDEKISTTSMAIRADVSVAVIYKIQKGESVSEKSIEKVENVLAGRLMVDPNSAPKFDESCEAFIEIVRKLVSQQNEYDELLRIAFEKWGHIRSKEESEAFALQILRQYLAAIPAVHRVTALLEIRDMFSTKK